jgi:hypothetical protein
VPAVGDELHTLAGDRVGHRLDRLFRARLAVNEHDLDLALLAVDHQRQVAIGPRILDRHRDAVLDLVAGTAGRTGEGSLAADLERLPRGLRAHEPGLCDQERKRAARCSGRFEEPPTRHRRRRHEPIRTWMSLFVLHCRSPVDEPGARPRRAH